MIMSRDRRHSSIKKFYSSVWSIVVVHFAYFVMVPMRRAAALVGWRVNRRLVSTCRTNALYKFPELSSQCNIQSPRFISDAMSQLMMAAVDEDEAVDSAKTLDSTWNIPGLKKEVNRLILRCHKKIAKTHTRLTNAQKLVDKLTSDDSATLEQLEECPDTNALEFELNELRSRLSNLNELERMLDNETKKNVVLPVETATLCLQLGVNDEPPKRPPRVPKKTKGPKQEASRLPYRRFYTKDKTEIRVGKQAEDNDELSLNPEHRDGSDWWMHASGCPGSHVVIRCSDQNLDEEVVMDAAALAARQSKCNGSVIKVSLTRCRDVKKPPGAKAGLVQLTGRVRTVSVNMKEAESRLERLDKTVKVN